MGEERWLGRIPLANIGEFILAADQMNMDVVTVNGPYPHRYKLRCETPGSLRLWAEFATLACPAGSERHMWNPPQEIKAGAQYAASPLQDRYPHYLVKYGPPRRPGEWRESRVFEGFEPNSIGEYS